MSAQGLLACLIFACVASRTLNRIRSGRPDPLKSQEKLLLLAAVAVALLILLSPELIAFGFLGDTAFFDLLVLLIGLQFRGLAVQLDGWSRALGTRILQWGLRPRPIYLVALALWGVLASVVQYFRDGVSRG